jgi:glutamate synthase domain-containing protein 3
MYIKARDIHFKALNAMIRATEDREIVIDHCLGQRYIGAGLGQKKIIINGVPGNALGSYLDGSTITVYGNTQEATGDTMNEGRIIIHGNAGDATGYAMRGGRIFVKGNSGYRTGIHMKEYQDKIPVIVIGGRVGSFLGEYQAGGIIVVLGIDQNGELPVGYFTGTGMHGGKIFLRSDYEPVGLPPQVICREATAEDKEGVLGFVKEFCDNFGGNPAELLADKFYVLLPNTKNPYKQLYVNN